MKKSSHSVARMFSLATAIVLLSEQSARAYIDPATGSLILQGIIAAVVGSLVAVKIFWGKIKNFNLRIFGKKNHENPIKKDGDVS